MSAPFPQPTLDDLWSIEERLWTGGADDYAATLHPRALMAFARVGLLDAAAVLESIEGQRWQTVAASDQVLSQVSDEVVVLGYRATARKAAGPPYRCVCTSTYVRSDDAWLLVQHQQSAE